MIRNRLFVAAAVAALLCLSPAVSAGPSFVEDAPYTGPVHGEEAFTPPVMRTAGKPAAPRGKMSRKERRQAAEAGDSRRLERQMAGAWMLSEGTGGTYAGRRVKFFGNGLWSVTETDPFKGTLISHHGGSYTLDGDRYAETVDYATDGNERLIGSTFEFTVSVKRGQFTQVSTNKGNPFTETWVRPDAE